MLDETLESADGARSGGTALAPAHLIVFAVSGHGINEHALRARVAQWTGADVCVSSWAAGAAIGTKPGAESPSSVDAAALRVIIASPRGAVFLAAHRQLSGTPLVQSMRLAADAAELRRVLEERAADMLLLDETLLPELDAGLTALLRRRAGEQQVLLLCDDTMSRSVDSLLSAGMRGCLAVDAAHGTWLRALVAVRRGELWLPRALLQKAALATAQRCAEPICLDRLTPRERQAVELLREGLSNKQMARQLGIGEDTVKKHLQSVFAKLGVHRRALVALGRLAPGSP